VNEILSLNRVYDETKTMSGGQERDFEIINLLLKYDTLNDFAKRINNISIETLNLYKKEKKC
jgi:hypothetical protein